MADIAWDVMAMRYRSGTSGRFVSESAVRAEVDKLVQTAGDRLADLTARLKDGALTLPDWQAQMRAELKSLHVVTATVAHGGKAQMAPSDYGWTGARLKEQYRFLAGFAEDAAAGKPLSAGRARLYAEAARATFQEMHHRDARLRGATEERWVRRVSESCEGCKAQAEKRWVPAGTLPRLGSQDCKSRCKCVIQTRTVAQEAA